MEVTINKTKVELVKGDITHQGNQRNTEIVCAIKEEMCAYKIPARWDIWAKMVISNHPKLNVTERKILHVLKNNPNHFEEIDDYVYWLKG